MKFIEAMDALFFAMRVVEDLAWHAGWQQHQEWMQEQLQKVAEQADLQKKEVQAKMNAMAAALMTGKGSMTVAAEVHQLTAAPLTVGSPTFTAPTLKVVDRVYETIQQHPGLTGVELVRHLEKAGTPLNERTVRTAIFRLKKDKIQSVQHRWYPIDVARELMEANPT